MFDRMEEEGMEIVQPDTSEMEAAAVEIQDRFAEQAGWTDTLERARELQ
jgi:TRAP-type C4-dicarboxylate transport system substrate-binding protein